MSHSGSFGITTPGEFFDQLLLPQHRDFLSDNASSRFALTCAVFGYHLYEWVNTAPGKDFKADFKARYSSHPAKDHLAEMFDLARRLTNGTKHFGNRVGTERNRDLARLFHPRFADLFT